jgi:TFIIF-interacting CTD phosphatase-like protein
LDQIDPENELFSLRLYRDQCIQSGKFFIKDLRILEPSYDLKDLVIIDNSVISFAHQLNNGIPIQEFTGHKDEAEDQELLYMVQFLEDSFGKEDVRDAIRESFNFEALVKQTAN